MLSEEGCRICVLKELSCFMSFMSLLIKIKYSVCKFKDHVPLILLTLQKGDISSILGYL